MADINEIAKQFTDFYYSTFDSNRGGLTPLYKPNSMLTFEGQQFQGMEKIVEKLQNLPFQRVVHKIDTLDAQPSDPNLATPSLMVSVTGQLVVDDSETPLKFSQSFQLVKDPAGNYFVFNDIFRLNYG